MQDNTQHWKPRVIYGLFSCYLLNIFDSIEDTPQLLALFEAFLNLSTTGENQHLNQLGRAGIHRIINQNKRINKNVSLKSHIYLKSTHTLNTNNNNEGGMEEEVENQERSLETFF